jgi:hypothetical protein
MHFLAGIGKGLQSLTLSRLAELAARLLYQSGEQRNLSTSSFRPPGGPTPTRGFFLPGEPLPAIPGE